MVKVWVPIQKEREVKQTPKGEKEKGGCGIVALFAFSVPIFVVVVTVIFMLLTKDLPNQDDLGMGFGMIVVVFVLTICVLFARFIRPGYTCFLQQGDRYYQAVFKHIPVNNIKITPGLLGVRILKGDEMAGVIPFDLYEELESHKLLRYVSYDETGLADSSDFFYSRLAINVPERTLKQRDNSAYVQALTEKIERANEHDTPAEEIPLTFKGVQDISNMPLGTLDEIIAVYDIKEKKNGYQIKCICAPLRPGGRTASPHAKTLRLYPDYEDIGMLIAAFERLADYKHTYL